MEVNSCAKISKKADFQQVCFRRKKHKLGQTVSMVLKLSKEEFKVFKEDCQIIEKFPSQLKGIEYMFLKLK